MCSPLQSDILQDIVDGCYLTLSGCRTLDATDYEIQDYLHRAMKKGWIRYQQSGGMTEISLSDVIIQGQEKNMSKIDDLVLAYKKQVSLPWADLLSAQEKVWFCVYDPSQERRLRKQIDAFAIVTQESGHIWLPLDITSVFDQWLATNEYKENYFKTPTDLKYEENTFLEFFS